MPSRLSEYAGASMRTDACAFAEGIPHSRMGAWVAHPLGLRVKREGSEKLRAGRLGG